MTSSGAFVFDMDGTLVDNMGVHVAIWLKMLAERGVAVTEEEFHRRASGRNNTEIVREFFGEAIPDAEALEWTNRKEARYREVYAPQLRPVEGLHDFLEAARALGVPMALATSGPLPNARFVLEGLRIEEFFTVVVTGEAVAHGKPDPEIFLTAAGRLGVAPEQCVVFEDSRAGIEAARRAGMHVVVLATAPDPGALDGVLRVVPRFSDLDPGELLRAGQSSCNGSPPARP